MNTTSISSNTKRTLLSMLATLAVLTAATFAWWHDTQAQQLGFTPFGGLILNIQECTCSGGLAVTIGPPNPGVFYYQPGASTLYREYAMVESAWNLGNAISGGACSAGRAGCAPIPVQGTMTIVGTSLPGAGALSI